MTVVPSGDFMTGVLGFSTQEQMREFDLDSWSWVKARPRESDAASRETVAPFAVDLRDHERWVSFVPAPRLRPPSFGRGLELVLNEAVGALGLLPEAWEFDLVVSRSRVEEWLRAHPAVHRLRRTIKFTNPGLDLDRDRAEMRALHANRKTEEFKARRGDHLAVGTEAFDRKLDGVETGDLELYMEARGRRPGVSERFSSQKAADETYVDDFGLDLQRGMEYALAALRDYVLTKHQI